MRKYWVLSPTLVTLCVTSLTAQTAGWPGVFPEVPGYARRIEAPVVGKDRTKEFRQTANYEWTGGDIRTLKATLARTPGFKPDAPTRDSVKVKVGKRDAWLAGNVLTIPLGGDRTLRLEGGGSEVGKEVLPLARPFNLDRIEKALENPPRTDFKGSVETFRAITKDMTYADVTAWTGDAERDIGSGIHIMEFALPDGGKVLIGTADFIMLRYIKHVKAGKVEDLLR